MKVAGGILGILVLAYLALVTLALWEFRVHTYTTHSVPNALTNDDTALRLAQSALKLHGLEPTNYTPGTYFGGVTVGRNTLDSNRVSTHWIPRSRDISGFGVALRAAWFRCRMLCCTF